MNVRRSGILTGDIFSQPNNAMLHTYQACPMLIIEINSRLSMQKHAINEEEMLEIKMEKFQHILCYV
jgi:hypothetical protein